MKSENELNSISPSDLVTLIICTFVPDIWISMFNENLKYRDASIEVFKRLNPDDLSQGYIILGAQFYTIIIDCDVNDFYFMLDFYKNRIDTEDIVEIQSNHKKYLEHILYCKDAEIPQFKSTKINPKWAETKVDEKNLLPELVLVAKAQETYNQGKGIPPGHKLVESDLTFNMVPIMDWVEMRLELSSQERWIAPAVELMGPNNLPQWTRHNPEKWTPQKFQAAMHKTMMDGSLDEIEQRISPKDLRKLMKEKPLEALTILYLILLNMYLSN